MRTTARRGIGRIRGASPRPLDALLALTLTVVVEVEVFTATAADPPVDRVLALVTGLSVLMLAVRRCRPLATILVICVAVFAEALIGGRVVDLGSPALVLLVAAYSLGAHAPPPRAAAGVLVSVALLTGANQLVSAIEYSTLDDAVFFGLAVGLPAALGAAVTRRRALERRLGELVAWLEAEGDPADLALAAESARIGERIDAVATERLGEITLRAAGAERAAERDPAEVPRALAEIEHAARDTLEQMRTIVGALRREDEDPGLLALPSLSRLHELVGAQRADGARVELEVEGVPGPLDPGADAAAFRLVQETVRRADDDVRVRVRYAARAVELELSGGSAQRLEWLAPLTRRVELQGGDVDVSARDPLTVWARIPAERPAMSAARRSHRAPDAATSVAPLRERLAGLRHDPRVPDALIVLGVAAAMAIEIQTSSALSGPRAANFVFAAAVAAPLAWRRSSPRLAALAIYVAAAVGSALLTPLGLLVTPLIILVLPPFALGEAPRRTVAVAGLVVCLAGLVALGAATPDGQDDGSTVAALMLVVISWAAGFGYARLAARTRELQRRIFEIEQRQLERQAVQLAAERRRIGRELHDTIAHGMSAVVLQAAAGRRIFDADPAGARRALGAVSETARQTLEECRRSIVGLGGEAPLGELLLDSLIERARAAGITVDLRTVGSLGSLSAERGMVAYRVIQEALTNVSRHAAPTHATVRILAGEDGVELEVVDRGRLAPAPTEVRGSGRGLQSMRERVEHSGGTLEAGPLPGRGFQVRARLPAGALA